MRESPTEPQPTSGEKNEVKQQGYEDSESKTKIWSDEKRTEKSKANSRQKSKANGRQSKPKDFDREKAKYEEKYHTMRRKTNSNDFGCFWN